MINFDFFTPTKILFGAGRESEVGKQVAAFGGHKVMIIYGKKGGHIETSGLLDRVHKSLSDAGLSYVDLNGVVPNPRLSLVKEGIRIGRAEGVDFLLPIGGGSVIDTAKGIGYGIANDFEMEDLLYGHDCARPKFAIMNPELTYSLPAYQTASGAADIMMHTMERYFTPTDTDTSLTDRIAEGLMVSVRDAAQIAVKEPENYEARATLMWAGSLSHNGLTGAGRISDFATHKIEHELGGMFDVAHGAGLAAVWGSWARYVYKTNPGRFAQFGKKVFGINISSSTNITPNSDAPEQPIKPSPIITDPELTSTDTAALAAITAWETWCHSISMPTTLTELGIHPTDTQIEEMAEKCVFGRNGHVGFFQPLTKEDIAAILKMAK